MSEHNHRTSLTFDPVNVPAARALTVEDRAAITAPEIASAFDALASARRWVAWRNEWRGDRDVRKLTKVPFGRDCRPAKADDPSTWLTREEASALAKSTLVHACVAEAEDLATCETDGSREAGASGKLLGETHGR